MVMNGKVREIRKRASESQGLKSYRVTYDIPSGLHDIAEAMKDFLDSVGAEMCSESSYDVESKLVTAAALKIAIDMQLDVASSDYPPGLKLEVLGPLTDDLVAFQEGPDLDEPKKPYRYNRKL